MPGTLLQRQAEPRTVPGVAAAAELCRILEIRLVLLTICLAAGMFAWLVLGLNLPIGALAVGVVVAFATTAAYRLWLVRATPVAGSNALTLQLLIDIALLTAVLAFTGGWTNPLVSLYLVPIAVAAALLPRRSTWFIAVAAVLCYAGLTRWFQPLFDLHHDHGGSSFSLHISGMWLTFVLCAILLAYFGTRFAETLRQRDLALAEAREAGLRSEQIIGVATLAAGTAHELATPLATIGVIAAELEAHPEPDPETLRDDIAELSRQVSVCRAILARLRTAANPETRRRSAAGFLAELFDRFRLLHPAVPLDDCFAASEDAALDTDLVLHQALLNLLDNAANASPEGIACHGRIEGSRLVLDILDRGPGFAEPGAAGARVRSPAGLGMGLVLTNTTLERRGGLVTASPRAGGGTCVRVEIPLLSPGTDADSRSTAAIEPRRPDRQPAAFSPKGLSTDDFSADRSFARNHVDSDNPGNERRT